LRLFLPDKTQVTVTVNPHRHHSLIPYVSSFYCQPHWM
jgi:hypothetical protein